MSETETEDHEPSNEEQNNESEYVLVNREALNALISTAKETHKDFKDLDLNSAEDIQEVIEKAEERPNLWIDLSTSEEGVSLTVYREATKYPQPTVVEETWWTWAEFTGMNTKGMNISREINKTTDLP